MNSFIFEVRKLFSAVSEEDLENEEIKICSTGRLHLKTAYVLHRSLLIASIFYGSNTINNIMAAVVPVVRIGIGVASLVFTGAAGAYAMYKKRKARRTDVARPLLLCALCKEELDGLLFILKCKDEFHVKCLKLYVHSHGKCSAKCPKCKNHLVLTLEEREEMAITLGNGPHYCHFCQKITNERRRALPCDHYFCFQCLRKYFVALVSIAGEDPKCPMLGCEVPVPSAMVTSIIQDTPEITEVESITEPEPQRSWRSWFRIRSP